MEEPKLFPYKYPNISQPSHPTPTCLADETDCSETSTYKIQTPGNYPEESIQDSERGGSLKSRICALNNVRAVTF